jgi:hypothetical protein
VRLARPPVYEHKQTLPQHLVTFCHAEIPQLLVYDTIVRGQQSISDRTANAKMPLYEIEHVCPITPDQQQSIANAIVKIHSEMFTTPSLFVNVRFKDTNALPLFVAGQRVSNSAINKTRFHSFTLLYPSTFFTNPRF